MMYQYPWLMPLVIAFAAATATCEEELRPGAREYLEDEMPRSDPRYRALVARKDEIALRLLMNDLAHERVQRRRGAAQCLGNFLRPGLAAPAIPALAKALADEDGEVRMLAASAIARLVRHVECEAAKAPLAIVVKDKYALVRRYAAFALSLVDPESDAAGEALMDLRNNADKEIRREAMAALLEMGPRWSDRAVRLVIEALKSKDAKKRSEAAMYAQPFFGTTGEGCRPLVPVLAELATGDDDGSVRRTCVLVLKRLGPVAKEALPTIRKALGDKDESVASEAIDALARIGPEVQDIPALKIGLEHEDGMTRGHVARALACLGPEGVATLVERFDSDDAKERSLAYWAVGFGGEHAAPVVPRLISILKGLRDVKPPPKRRSVPGCSAIMEALGNLGPLAAEAVPELIWYARGGVPYDASGAIRTLGEIGEAASEAVPTLTDLLKDDDWRVSKTAAKALGGIGPKAKAAVPRLREMTKDKRGSIRRAASEALKLIQQAGASQE